MGHLLTDTVVMAEPGRAEAWLFRGGAFTARHDAETNFPLFVPVGAGVNGGNAALLTIRPHEELRTALEATAVECGLPDARVLGLGSLIGAEFEDAPPMASPISEIAVCAGARLEAGRCTALPIAAVDLDGRIHRGSVRSAPICVTGEFMLLA